MQQPLPVVVLKGDETGQELLEEALQVIEATGLPVRWLTFDLSLENRRRTRNEVVFEAGHALREVGRGLKAATITPEGKEDVGSPNAILREVIGAEVILRTGRRIPGVRPVTGVMAPIAVVRMAVEDAYGAREWREGEGLEEVAFRTSRVSRRHCRAAAEFAFRHARAMGARVFGGPKYTVSPVYEGMLKEELDAASRRYPDVPYEPRLIDAVYALILRPVEQALVIPALNRDGDCLSDLILQLFGSLAAAESLVVALDEGLAPAVVMAEAPHGTAPDLKGKNMANPMAMILAGAALLEQTGDERGRATGAAIRAATFGAVEDGTRTADLGGAATTREFTAEVAARVRGAGSGR